MASGRVGGTATQLSQGRVLIAGGKVGYQMDTAAAEMYDSETRTWQSAGSMATAREGAAAVSLQDGEVLVVGGVHWTNQNRTSLASAELYDPTTNSWGSAGTMAVPRGWPAAVLLGNGNVLVAGGWTNQLPCCSTASAELYDPAANSWSSAGSMTGARTLPDATMLPTGNVLVTGGFETCAPPPCNALATGQLYHPATNSWSAAASMSIARAGHASVLLPDGRLLVAGGASAWPDGAALKSAELYNAATNTWSSAATMHTARTDFPAVVLTDGTVLAIGGASSFPDFVDDLGGPAIAAVEAYNPRTNTWIPEPSLSIDREFSTATPLPDASVLVAGGGDGPGSAQGAPAVTEIYSTPVPGTAKADSLNVARWGHVAVRLNDGRVLVAGGSTATNSHSASAEIYDPDTNTWTPAASMNKERQSFAVVKLNDGRILVVGGFGGTDIPLDIGYLASAEIYDPDSDKWTEVAPMSTPRENLTATLLASGKVLVAGGDNVDGGIDTAEFYDPQTNSWTSAGTMSAKRESPAAVALKSGKVLVIGGIDPSGLSIGLASADLYDPTTNGWRAAASMSTGRDHPLAVRLQDGRVLVAGGYLTQGVQVLKSAEIYKPATDTWSPGGTMLQERTFGPANAAATATVLQGGNVLVTGGATSAGDTLESAELYLPSLNTWLPAPALPTPASDQTATLLRDGRVLIAGGSGDILPTLANCELYAAPAPVSIVNNLFDPTSRVSNQAQGILWTDVQGTHTVVDSANLGEAGGTAAPLFASGSLTAGKTFTFTFFAAGTYSYHSTAGEPTAMSGKIAVPLKLGRTQDGSGRLQLTWADAALADEVEDVQTRFEPLGSTTFGPWQTWKTPGGSASWPFLDGLFTPSATGTYQFRARMRNVATGHVSGWSPAAAFTLR